MQIWDTARIREWDRYTISHEPITSLDLMERAATVCFEWLLKHHYSDRPIAVFCGKGNNGGDGLALARLLAGLEACTAKRPGVEPVLAMGTRSLRKSKPACMPRSCLLMYRSSAPIPGRVMAE